MRGVEGVAQQRVQARRSIRVALPRFYFAGILSVLGGLLLWELVSRFLVANALFLAAPSQIFTAIAALAKTGELWRHISISAVEFALGYAIASVLGVGIGFAMAESATMKRVLQPWISGLYATPTGGRPFRLRQDDIPAHRCGSRTGQRGRGQARRPPRQWTGRRPRLRVPDRQSLALAHRVRERDHRARSRGPRRSGGAAAHDGAPD